jgi:pyrroloquinoline-quinone synthase
VPAPAGTAEPNDRSCCRRKTSAPRSRTIKGREAKNASFSRRGPTATEREHLSRWAENHYHYVGPFADYLACIYANTPDHATDAKDFLLQNMYEEELSDIRHTDC